MMNLYVISETVQNTEKSKVTSKGAVEILPL